jgi:putative transposase
MRTLFTSFFALLANAAHKELARQVRYLKAENRILRDRLPERIKVTAAGRRRLIRFGKPLGSAIRELITILWAVQSNPVVVLNSCLCDADIVCNT